MSDNRFLEGQVALVTGAGRGIGRALALGFADAGAAVMCAARTESEITAAAAEIIAAGGTARAVPTDVTDAAAVDALLDATAQELGRLDVLVLNAGANEEPVAIAESDPARWWSTFECNVLGAYLCARAAIPLMKADGGGKIIVVGSGARHRAGPSWSAYAGSKSALWMVTRILAQELREHDIAVNELIPGPVDTRLAQHVTAPITPAAGSPFAGEWFKQPEDVVGLALFLAGLPNRGPTAQSFSLLGRDA